jgi:hypothetical protein
VPATNGHFTQTLTLGRAGRYSVVARTQADAENLAGASSPLAVTV